MNLILIILKRPKVQVSLTLFLIYFSGFGRIPIDKYFGILIASLISAICFDLLISYLRIRKLFLPHAAVVSGLIIALLANPNMPLWQIVTICAIAMASKNFIRVSGKHIFNPAGFGLFIGGLIFLQNVAWWGTSFQYSSNLNAQTLILNIILLSPLYISAYRMRRHFSIAAFIIVNTILTLFSIGNFSPTILLITLLNPTIVFFSIVMLPEPMTSPSKRNLQILFGVTAAVLNFILTSNTIAGNIFIPDSLIASLLVANLIFLKK